MRHHIAYYCATDIDPPVEAQRAAMGGSFDQEFADDGAHRRRVVDRPGFAALLASVRSGDTVYVHALDRFGRDAREVEATMRRLLDAGVTVEVHGLGAVGGGAGEPVLAVLAQLAAIEWRRIAERSAASRPKRRTQRGKGGRGRPHAHDVAEVRAWRRAHKASIAETARQFALSPATVKRYCAAG